MNLTQAFKIAIKSIAAKKARSALTMLGVSSSSLYIIKGAIILCACALDMRKYMVKK